ncbi:MAG TPA: helix-turn-helix transcriptional regulator, partial [Clostridiaceae bacterium]|nr:helix-turn-helix transcriptional regulator [Clostridiaceae bacterium]
MFENFLKIDITKQKRVLAAALEVFSREGYLRANTNEIAALAEISKGLLFHYFGSKKNLYLFLLDETV